MKRNVKSSAERLRFWLRACALGMLAALMAGSGVEATAQSCQISSDLDDATRSAITAAGERYFDMAAKGDTASMHQRAVGSLATDFSGVEATIKDHQQELMAGQAMVRSVFELESDGSGPHAEFYCGVFGKNGQTANSAIFYLSNLPAGKYAIVVLDVNSPSGKATFSVILEQAGTDWKLGGLYIKSALVGGHDTDWFINQARQYKAKGQLHNAWFYYRQAQNMISPLSFMSTAATEKLYNDSQAAQPSDVPANGKTVDLAAGAVTYKLIDIFPDEVGKDLDLIVKYQSADASNANQAYQTNVAVMKALVARYPEIRDGFAAVVARGVDSSGRDYGTLLAIKDIK